MLAIIRSYSTYEGTFTNIEGFAKNKEIAEKAISFLENKNQENLLKVEELIKKVEQHYKKRPDIKKCKNNNKMIDFFKEHNALENELKKIVDICDKEFSWYYEEVYEFTNDSFQDKKDI